ncbi:MAG: Ger(x)C family spore germination protein, partial [Halanaerobiales bacterium]
MQTKKRKLILALFLCLLLLPFGGCWDAREFDKLTFIKGIAIDPAEEKDRIKFSVQIVKPGGGSQGQTPGEIASELISSTGYTVYEANRNLIKQIGRSPFYGHNEVVIINEKLARQGINPFLDIFLRNKEIRGRVVVAISKGDASNILNKTHYLDNITASGIKIMLNGVSASGTIVASEIIPLETNLLNKYRDPVTSAIELKPGGPPSEEESSSDSSSSSKEGQSGDGKNLIYASGGALFKGDKLVDFLTRKEARGYNWIFMPDNIRGPVVINTGENELTRRISIEIYRVNSDINPHYDGSNFSVDIDVKTEGFIIEELEQDLTLTQDEQIENLNKKFAQVVNNEIYNALEKGRQHNADILG